MYKFLFVFITCIPLLFSCGIMSNKKKNSELIERRLIGFNYVYHFYKQELEDSHIQPAAYKPKVYDIRGRVTAEIFPNDTLIRFVSKSKDSKGDGRVELYKPVKLTNSDYAKIPSMLLGCHLLGVYNSSAEDIPGNFYYCFYVNERNDLLNVLHLYKPGNISAAFFYTENSIDSTKYKNDVASLLGAERPLNLTDTVVFKFN